MQAYVNSDLAIENNNISPSDEDYEKEETKIATICRLKIKDKEKSKLYGKPQGNYVTVFCEKIWLMDSHSEELLAAMISSEIEKMMQRLFQSNEIFKIKVLVAGLGNSEITADAIGPLTVNQLTVTRHMHKFYKKLFGNRDITSVSAIQPGVLAQTGIETVEIIKSVADTTKPDLIIVIDALAARNCDRLGCTVQISDTGISPGSGIGNVRRAISEENIGVPVIAIGVPTVVNSSTLVCDVLQEAGVTHIDKNIEDVLNDGKDFFVSPKEIDMITKTASRLLALSLDLTFGTR